MNTPIDKQLLDTAIAKLAGYFEHGANVEILAYCDLLENKFTEFLVRHLVNVTESMYSEDYYLLLLRKRNNEWWLSLLEENIKVVQWSDENKNSIVKVSSDYLELINDLKEEIKVQEYIEKKLEEKIDK